MQTGNVESEMHRLPMDFLLILGLLLGFTVPAAAERQWLTSGSTIFYETGAYNHITFDAIATLDGVEYPVAIKANLEGDLPYLSVTGSGFDFRIDNLSQFVDDSQICGGRCLGGTYLFGHDVQAGPNHTIQFGSESFRGYFAISVISRPFLEEISIGGRYARIGTTSDELDLVIRDTDEPLMIAVPVPPASNPVFHLDFEDFADASGNDLPLVVGDSVSLSPQGGPQLANRVRLHAGRWQDQTSDFNQILILDNPVLDRVSVGAGAITTWINPDDGTAWNNILKTVCPDAEPCEAFGPERGIEFQASGTQSGTFGTTQGWGGGMTAYGPLGRVPFRSDTPTGEWTHLALTWNEEGDRTIYVNGVPGTPNVGLANGAEFGQNQPDDWIIGGDPVGSNRGLEGMLADLAIFDSELTHAQVLHVMLNGAVDPDCNGDGALNIWDTNCTSARRIEYFLEDHGTVPGDADGIGGAAFADFLILSRNFGQSPAAYTDGDFDVDGEVGFSDFLVLSGNFGQGGDFMGSTMAVPEPSSLALLLLGLMGTWRFFGAASAYTDSISETQLPA